MKFELLMMFDIHNRRFGPESLDIYRAFVVPMYSQGNLYEFFKTFRVDYMEAMYTTVIIILVTRCFSVERHNIISHVIL